MDDGRNESPNERADRNLAELLQELRVALPGVQVLFAFLLTVPFQPRFEDVTTFQRDVYVITLLFSALTTALLIAPTAYHRLNFRQGDKEHIVNVASGLTIAGLVALSFAMSGAVLLVMDWLLDGAVVVIIFAVVALGFALLWFAVPLRRRMQKRAVSSEG
jgi:predicted membrane channel-forming protein YqfA (hemolysin III family)